jgi:hypothetical protein
MESQKWYQSKIFRLALALFVGGIGFLLTSLNVIDQESLDAAKTVYPQLAGPIAMIQAGNWFGGGAAIIGILIAYFRVYKTTRIVTLSLPSSTRKAA